MKTLEAQAERESIAYQAARASHKPTREQWRKLRSLRARAIKASLRKRKVVP